MHNPLSSRLVQEFDRLKCLLSPALILINPKTLRKTRISTLSIPIPHRPATLYLPCIRNQGGKTWQGKSERKRFFLQLLEADMSKSAIA